MERNGISVTLNIVWLLIPDELDRVLQGFTDTTVSRVYRGSFNAFLLKTGNWGYNSHSSPNAAQLDEFLLRHSDSKTGFKTWWWAHSTQTASKFTGPQEPLGCGAAGDSYHKCSKQMCISSVRLLCQHGPKSLRSVSSSSLNGMNN